MSFGFGLSLPSWQTLSGGFTPASLFSTGEVGAWYDPSDINVNWRYNLLTYTEQFDNAAWTKGGTTVSANITVAPDGTSSADKLVEDTSTGGHRTFQSSSFTAGTAYTFSVYAKASGRNLLQLANSMAGGFNATFDLTSGTVTNIASGTASITNSGNGWYRCSVSSTSGLTGTSNNQIRLVDTGTNTSYTGDGTSGAFIWGAQLQTGSVATAYQQIVTPEISYLSYQANPILYQDSAGTTPVTAVEQPVGLMLDKSKGLVLGSELVTNGDFSAGATGWPAFTAPINDGSIVVSGGVATVTTGPSTLGYAQQLSLVVGKTYRVSGLVEFVSGNGASIAITNAAKSAFVVQSSLVTAAGQPVRREIVFTATETNPWVYLRAGNNPAVGKFSDVQVRELPGNHAFQTTSTSRPTLRARYNLLTYSEQFDNAVWSKGNSSVTANTTVAPDGTVTADSLIEDTATSLHQISQIFNSGIVNTTYTFSVFLKQNTRTKARIAVSDNATGDANTIVDLSAGTVTAASVSGNWSSPSATIQPASNGYYRVVLTVTKSAIGNTSVVPIVGLYTTSNSYTGDGTSGIFIWGAQLLTAADVTATGNAYQRIAAATDYDTSNPVFRPYLAFDGSDDSMLTNSVDFSATDKMTVWAGVTKLSDAANGMVLELSSNTNTNTGAFYFATGTSSGAGPNYVYSSRGTASPVNANSLSSYASPITNVATGVSDISAPVVTLRLNGVQNVTDAASQGTGNYGNYPLYIGRRNNATLPFNGRAYSLIVRGEQSTAAQISSTESWVNQRTGAY